MNKQFWQKDREEGDFDEAESKIRTADVKEAITSLQAIKNAGGSHDA